jgi:cobalt-precorrin-5B (C1)-methyltransferase
MLDPVTGFEYPAGWVRKCLSAEEFQLVENGLAVLTSSGAVLKRGFTTGTTAAAASKAAILSLTGDVSTVSVRLPCGLVVKVPVEGRAGRASCKKYAGDYPADVTAGIEFIAMAISLPEGVRLVTGDGIGKFSRDTPRFARGTPAISPTALESIYSAIRDAQKTCGLSGIEVTLSVPSGVEIARKTLNSRVGVEGGISVLGTTGLVEPWDDHLTVSVLERIASAEKPVLTTGRIGLKYSRLFFPDRDVILVGGKIAESLASAHGEVILCGLPALILRFINPQILDGTGFRTVEEFMSSAVSGAVVIDTLAGFRKQSPSVHVVLIDREGKILAESP